MTSRATDGFTLIEVLVALTITAVAMSALLRVSGLAAENSAALRSRMQAGWVAEDRLAGLRARPASLPASGRSDGQLEQDGQRWVWQQHVAPVADEPGLLRVEVRVALPDAPGYPLAVLAGYLALPRP